jgi:hypothetical protein
LIDDLEMDSGYVMGLDHGDSITRTLTWRWDKGNRTISFVVDPDDQIEEISENNNSLEDRTNALFLEILVHPYVYEAFDKRVNLTGSYSFEDWIQAQFETMNQRLKEAVYPETPQGVLDQVRIDSIVVTTTLNGWAVESPLDYDGGWTFGVAEDDHHTPQDEARESAEDYAARFASRVDWGLIHELTHQLGIIDLYRLDLSASWGNRVLDRDGLPLLMGFSWPNPGLMGGGDTYPHNDPTYYSSHTAVALNRHAGYRRGYYGEYLFDIPKRNYIQVLDNRGDPIPGAQVEMYQTRYDLIDDVPEIVGQTDAEGIFIIPNRPAQEVTTETGHTLRDNPFGLIDVVGLNGRFLVRISKDNQESFHWLDITQFNLAYWHGYTEAYTFTIETHLPPIGAPFPPGELMGLVEGDDVQLGWEASPSPDIVGYNVYRAEEPDYPFEKVAERLTTLSYGDRLKKTSRYAVTAVSASGLESGFTNVFRAPWLFISRDVAFSQPVGRRIILDAHGGALIHQLPDERFVGWVGSEHLGLVGSRALALNAQGQMAIASGDGRLVALDTDSGLITWFGGLETPGGAVLSGEGFTIEQPLGEDEQSLFLCHLDGSLVCQEEPEKAEGITFTEGRFGQGILVNEDDILSYSAEGNFDQHRGSVEMWVQPLWEALDWREHVFFEAGDGVSYQMRLAKTEDGALYFLVRDYNLHEYWLMCDIRDWQPGQWHHLAVTWQENRLALYVDGGLKDSRTLAHSVTGTVPGLYVGVSLEGTKQAEAVLDELRISDFPRLGNSDYVRLVVADNDRLLVFDLLGNLLSTYDEGNLSQPRGMAVDKEGHIVVAEGGSDRLQVLDFDGVNLSFSHVITASLKEPGGVAIDPQGQIVVADTGNDLVKVLSADGALLAQYDRPNDAHTGPFERPEGVAIGPAGEIIVADTGNRRVASIVGGLEHRVYLPLINKCTPISAF